ncbi:hypothetical protein Zmor_018656 [Zophobas morio]|uniref:Retrovirus-related Pol polyprotein from transposon TNT 1-94-like beta-barrel domain-containing protein n=1 Tax=Zophobas morio TaxID=2755281 RepID=A0AA38MDW4_9CUCU|nr:hypothetical protein Zmor_018656 [Zophobas morio]
MRDWNNGKGTSKNKAESSFFAFRASNQQYTDAWYVDSCASCHRIANSEWLENPKQCRNTEISASDNSKMEAEAVGNEGVTVSIQTKQ